MDAVDKRALLERLRAALQDEIERGTRQARDAAEAATHVEARAEGDKDMRATEASYIARGQAARVAETRDALARLGAMPLKAFPSGARIEASALVDLEHDGEVVTYFLVPAAGGRTLAIEGVRARTLATTSPLGRVLLGLTEGDDVEVATPAGIRDHAIVRVR